MFSSSTAIIHSSNRKSDTQTSLVYYKFVTFHGAGNITGFQTLLALDAMVAY
jgi:hypothetical protein